jgi:hypothetical protein
MDNQAGAADSLGSEQRLRWSTWSRCESSFSLWLVPNLPGVFVLGEEVIAPGESSAVGGKRMLAVLAIDTAEDLSRALSRLFASASPIREKLMDSRCFIRYAVVHDAAERESVRSALEHWLAGNAEPSAQPAFAAAEDTAVANGASS